MALSGYGVYAEVTFAASAVDEAIPFLTVYLSDLPTAWHDAMANAGDTDGRTIRVTKSDGTTECAVYVPPGSVNTTTDTGCLLFRATDLSAVVDTVYMIWVGNAASTMYLSTDTYGRNAVFTGYAGAYIPGMTTDDLTGAGRNLTAVNSPGAAASGYEGITAATYNGTNQYHWAVSGVVAMPLTMEAIAKYSSNTGQDFIAGLGLSSSNNPYTGLTVETSTTIGGTYRGSSGGTTSTASKTSATSTSYYIASTRDVYTSGTSTIYLDGVAGTANTTNISGDPSYNRFAIGGSLRTAIVNHSACEVAVALLSSSVRSADYVATMNKNWLGTLYTASAVMYVTGTTGKLKLQTAAGASTSGSLADWANLSNALTIATDFATATVDWDIVTDSEFLELTNIAYNFAVPSGKSNYSAKFYVTRRHQSASGRISDLSVRFIDETGAYAGTDMAVYGAWSTVAATAEYTVSGTVLSDTRFDASTGLAFQITEFDVADTGEARVEFVCAEITWDEGAPATDYGNFFEAYGAFGNVA
jgi:hypothetical protein